MLRRLAGGDDAIVPVPWFYEASAMPRIEPGTLAAPKADEFDLYETRFGLDGKVSGRPQYGGSVFDARRALDAVATQPANDAALAGYLVAVGLTIQPACPALAKLVRFDPPATGATAAVP